MLNPVPLKYDNARNFIIDGDILLFRSSGVISKTIRVFSGGGQYSHIGIASYSTNLIELLEFREFIGARAVNLQREVEKRPGQIDVYRLTSVFNSLHYDRFQEGGRVTHKRIELDHQDMIKCMRELLGADYNYFSIWNIVKRQIPFIRWFYSNGRDNLNPNPNESKFICSTSIANCVSKSFFDIFPNKSNELITPNDWAGNPLLTYLFTLVP